MIKNSASLLPLLLLASFSFPNCTLAGDAIPLIDNWRFTSFGTLGFAHTQGDDLLAQHDLTQPQTFVNDNSWKLDSLIGAQVSADLTKTVSATVQGVVKSRLEPSLNHSIERAFVGWQATPTLSFHGGRLRQDFYMLADYRDAGFAYLWMRPPIEFYGPVLLNSLDGVDAVYNHPLDGGVLSLRVVAGHSKPNLRTNVAEVATLEFKDIYGLSVGYESDQWRLKAGAARLTFAANTDAIQRLADALSNPAVQTVWPGAQNYADRVTLPGKTIGFYSAGASYENLWQLSGEIGYITSDWDPLPDTLSAYLSVGRHIGTVTPYVLLARIRPTQDTSAFTAPQTIPIPAINAQLTSLYDGLNGSMHLWRFDQHTVSVGARWDVYTNLALKLQWDHSEINADSGGLWQREPFASNLAPAATVDLFSASLNWMY